VVAECYRKQTRLEDFRIYLYRCFEKLIPYPSVCVINSLILLVYFLLSVIKTAHRPAI